MHSRICLYGPDGSGKSTLVSFLAYYIERSGAEVRISWLRGTHTFASLIAKFLSHFPAFKGIDNPYYEIRIPRKMLRLWWALEFASVLPIWFFKYILPSTYEVVIGDRGLLDFLVWVLITTEPTYLRSIWGRATLALALRYCGNVYVIADLATLIKRKGNEPTSRLLLRQWIAYNTLFKYIRTPMINTAGKSRSESLRQLITYLGNLACGDDSP